MAFANPATSSQDPLPRPQITLIQSPYHYSAELAGIFSQVSSTKMEKSIQPFHTGSNLSQCHHMLANKPRKPLE